MLQALDPAQMLASTLGGRLGFHLLVPFLARCAARRGTNGRIVFGRQIRPWTLSGQRRSGIRLRSSRVADHDADMGLLCCANRALRRGVYSSLRPGARPRHSSGKTRRARRSEGNRVTTVDRSGRQVSLTSIELQQVGGRGKEFCGDSDRAWISQVPTHYRFHEPAALDRLALLENARTLL